MLCTLCIATINRPVYGLDFDFAGERLWVEVKGLMIATEREVWRSTEQEMSLHDVYPRWHWADMTALRGPTPKIDEFWVLRSGRLVE